MINAVVWLSNSYWLSFNCCALFTQCFRLWWPNSDDVASIKCMCNQRPIQHTLGVHANSCSYPFQWAHFGIMCNIATNVWPHPQFTSRQSAHKSRKTISHFKQLNQLKYAGRRDSEYARYCDMPCHTAHNCKRTHAKQWNENDRYALAQQFIIWNHHKNKQLNSNSAR